MLLAIEITKFSPREKAAEGIGFEKQRSRMITSLSWALYQDLDE